MRTPFRRRLRTTVLFASFAAFPFTVNFFSPYLSVAGSWSGIVAGSVLTFGLLLVTAPFLGRSFCSWACPAGALQEGLAPLNPRQRPACRWGRAKWFVWAPWMAALAAGWAVAGVQAVVPFWTPGAEPSRFLEDIGRGALTATGVTLLLGATALAVGRRGACHTLCWMAPFLILGRKVGVGLGLPGLRLTASPGCVSCGTCDRACPMGLPVQAAVASGRLENSECILCADCVDTCPKRVLGLGFGPGDRR